ncbi:S66 peptidase family protein [Wukongibacter sp. M2B1]|uniref:S66 peptidase family protein n=1 Tax=Wukongibacter sp. M2B1 TaxID=3088895 RepID=UPI003D79C95B
MIKSKTLKKGDCIGIVAPASPTPEEDVIRSKEALEKLGFEVKVGQSCYGRYGYLSGNDDLRAGDINRMFGDKNIDGIMCIRGGYGTPRILEKIDYSCIRKNPKVFIGYSDITAIHIALNQICRLITFHGPMASTDMIKDFDDFTRESLMDSIMYEDIVEEVKNPCGHEIQTLVKGCAEGLLVGGNLSLIAATIGTPYEIDTRGKILFIEDIDEEPYSIDRMLTQLSLSSKLDEASGFILGDWNNCIAKSYNPSLTLTEVLDDLIVPLNKPTICNIRAGHCKPMVTLQLGRKISIDGNRGKIMLK